LEPVPVSSYELARDALLSYAFAHPALAAVGLAFERLDQLTVEIRGWMAGGHWTAVQY